MVLYDLNPGSGANTSNMLQIARGICCDQQGNICQYVLNLATLGTITSITVKDRTGNEITTTVSGITDKVTLREAIVNALAAAGGRVHSGGLKITENAGAYYLSIMGEVEVVRLNNGSNRPFTKNCTQAWQCVKTFLVTSGVAGANNITVGDTTTSLGAITYPSTTASSLETIVDAISGVDSTNSSVEVDPVRQGYIIKVATDSKIAVFVNGKPALEDKCTPVFTT